MIDINKVIAHYTEIAEEDTSDKWCYVALLHAAIEIRERGFVTHAVSDMERCNNTGVCVQSPVRIHTHGLAYRGWDEIEVDLTAYPESDRLEMARNAVQVLTNAMTKTNLPHADILNNEYFKSTKSHVRVEEDDGLLIYGGEKYNTCVYIAIP